MLHPGMILAALLLAVLSCGALFADDDDDASIRRRRMGTIIVVTTPGAEVKVTQTRHEFLFGTALCSGVFRSGADPAVREKYLALAKDNFNAAVHENALKWYATERGAQGNPDWSVADRTLEWCEKNGLAMRGHCVYWGIEKHVQDWVKALDDASLRQALERRGREVTGRYRGRIRDYDVNNEMLHGDYYAKRLGPDTPAQMFRWAREGDPDAVLYVNDYDLFTPQTVDAYEKQITGLIKAGAPVGGIGIQCHFRSPVPMASVRETLDRLAKFDLPICLTEFDFETDDEPEKARFVADFYRTCFAHPAVEGILMWGFWEGAHWRPKAALWKKDFSPTPAAEAYRDLVFNRWWTRWQGKADAAGRCEVPAFFGRYLVEGAGVAKEVSLRKADGRVEVRLDKP